MVTAHRGGACVGLIADDDISEAGGALHDLTPLRRLDIDRQALFVAVERLEHSARIALARLEFARPVALQRLKFNDARAQVAEQHRAEGAGEALRQVHHGDIV